MGARREVKHAKADKDLSLLLRARRNVDQASTALGKRGRVWLRDGALDYNRRLVTHTSYLSWY
ncbi:hypothetical protein D3C80_1058120 [compost metagenome]